MLLRTGLVVRARWPIAHHVVDTQTAGRTTDAKTVPLGRADPETNANGAGGESAARKV